VNYGDSALNQPSLPPNIGARLRAAFGGLQRSLRESFEPREKCLVAQGAPDALGRAQPLDGLRIRRRVEEITERREPLEDGAGRRQTVVPPAEVRPHAGPAPVPSARDQTCPHGVQRHVADGGREVRLVHDDRSEPALPEAARALAARMDDAGATPVRAGQRPAQPVFVGRNQNEVRVIGHQAPGPDLHTRLGARLRQQIAIEGVVILPEECPRPAVAALGHVMRQTGNDEPRETGHVRGYVPGGGASIQCTVTEIQRACMTKVRAGMAVRRQAWPAAAEAPRSRPNAAARDGRVLEPDVCVLGGGAGGLSAAIAAASAGVSVLLVDERPELGGQFYKQPVPTAGESAPGPLDRQHRDGRALIAAAQSARVEILKGAQIWGAFEPLDLMISDGAGSRLCRPKRFIAAAGAYERGLPVPGWTLPGVMTTGAAQTLLRSYHVLPGNRVLVAGNGPLNFQVAIELARAGAVVVGVAELASRPAPRMLGALWRMAASAPDLALQGFAYLAGLRRRAIPIHYATALSCIEPLAGGLRAVLTSWNGAPGRGVLTHEVDAVCMGYGFMPSNDILRALGCKHRYDEARGHLVTEKGPDCETSVACVYAVGDCSGLGGARVALAEGTLAGFAAARSLGLPLSIGQQRQRTRARKELQAQRRFQVALWQLFAARRPLVELAKPDTVICRCEDLSLREITAALEQGAGAIGSLKRLTRAGMGACQGRYCGPLLAALNAARRGQPLDEPAFWAPRPPVKPIAISGITGLGE
jgi:NADPH-dependent 2,4-dienoyl-CoA reductase/sulfur reductase-like enzyme